MVGLVRDLALARDRQPLPADRERLALDGRPQPAQHLLVVAGWADAEQDLRGALVGVVRVVAVGRVAPGGRAHLGAELLDQLRRRPFPALPDPVQPAHPCLL
jgi:hypothetical protein